MTLRIACVATLVLVAVAFGMTPTDADASRVCRPRPCHPSPTIEGVPQNCRVRAFTANVSIPERRAPRRVVVRLDGRVVALGTVQRHSVRVRCSLLSPGEHRVSASARYRNWAFGRVRSIKKSRAVTFVVRPPLDAPAP